MADDQTGRFNVSWVDEGRMPTQKPNPNYPDGIDLDISAGAHLTCLVKLRHPTPRCGKYVIECMICGLLTMCSTAGRPDDPRSVKVACKNLIRT